jgi:NADH-quinone oxidoreductase subunit E
VDRQVPAEGRQQSAVIPMLWLVQKQEGWVSEPAIRVIAETSSACRSSGCYEVATFYTMFSSSPSAPNALVQVCGTTPCMLRGANDLKAV